MEVGDRIVHKGNVIQLVLNVIYFFGSLTVFFTGMIVYGILLNSGEVSLTEEMKRKGIDKLTDVNIIVRKSEYTVSLYSDTLLVKTYKAVHGRTKKDVKRSEEDFVTPVGKYTICSIDTTFLFHKLLRIDYPNEQDIHEALRLGIITAEQSRALYGNTDEGECPPVVTPIGEVIGLHGNGKFDFIMRNLPFVFNWTNGTVALSNRNIDELYSVVEIGTPVIITK